MQFLAHESQKQIEIQQNTTYFQIVVYLHSIELEEHTGVFGKFVTRSNYIGKKKLYSELNVYIRYVDLNSSNLNFKRLQDNDCKRTLQSTV